MKIEVRGTSNQKLYFVKFIKEATGMSLYDAKSLAEETIFSNNPLILDVLDYEQAIKLYHSIFHENNNTSNLTIKKHRSEIIKKFLLDNNEN